MDTNNTVEENKAGKTKGLTTAIKSYPFYFRVSVILVGMAVFFYCLMLLQDILVPLCFALLIAILLNPWVTAMVNRKIPKQLAIGIAVSIFFILLLGLVYFLSAQLGQFKSMLPEIKQRFTQLFNDAQVWLSTKLNISFQNQQQLIQKATSGNEAVIGKTVGGLLSILGTFTLLPIYTVLILYYKPLFQNFLLDIFDMAHSQKVASVLGETKAAIQSYVVGLLIELAIVGAMNSTALLIIGVNYALLLGCLGAILNLIPYIGGLVAIALPVMVSSVDSGGFQQPLLVIAAYLVIQLIDNNLLVPKIVSSKVSVNALASILVVLLGNALWGVSGMFLSLPFIAVLKVIFDHVDDLKPWGKLLGVNMPHDKLFSIRINLLRKFIRHRK